MTEQEKRVREIVATYTSAAAKLRVVAPALNWSNLLGDYGEYIGSTHYGLKLARAGIKGFDATDKDGNRVQIKTVSKSKQRKDQATVKLSSRNADHLLAIEVDEDASWKEIYYRPFDKIWRSSFKGMDKQKTINVGRLRKLQLETHRPNERVVVTLENGKEVVKDTLKDMRNYLLSVGRQVSGMSTITSRMNKLGKAKWNADQTFGTRVPPNYAQVEHLIKDDGYQWFPEKPTVSLGRTPVVSEGDRRIYISQGHFADKHNIPKDYVSDWIKEGIDPARIILRYRALIEKKSQ